jgi:ubiquinone/menaquinone biosynthesis C-methylase UbiE
MLGGSMDQNVSGHQFYIDTYDAWMSDWPGEIDFYRKLAAKKANSKATVVLDIACGTGRVGSRLAEDGIFVVGLDRSPEMLAIARQKSVNLDHIRWVEADMRSFELNQLFDLVMIPSHSFQNLNSADDQTTCIECIWRHLKPGGLLIIHLDHMNAENMKWLGEISGEQRGVFEDQGQFKHPKTGFIIKTSGSWSYEPASQTATSQTIWEEIDADGKHVRRWETGAVRLHCIFRFEMEHLLKRVGFEIEHVFGDFNQQELRDDSPHMIWLASKPNEHQ